MFCFLTRNLLILVGTAALRILDSGLDFVTFCGREFLDELIAEQFLVVELDLAHDFPVEGFTWSYHRHFRHSLAYLITCGLMLICFDSSSVM